MSLFSILKYQGFPCFEVPDASGGAAGAGAPVSVSEPQEPVETPAEISEGEAFALEAFEQLSNDEPEDEPLVPEPSSALSAPVEETPAATQVVPATPAVQTPVAQAKPGDATPSGPAQAQQTAAQPGAAPAAPAEPQAPAAPTAPDETTLQGLAQALDAQRDVFVKQLAQQRYKFTQEEMDRFQTEPAEFIAEVAARVQVETTQSLMRVMWSQLPTLINSTVQKRVAEDSAETAFWGVNPALDRAKHKALVDSVAPVFRKNFPQADVATFNKHVGAMVLGMLGQTALAVQQQASTNGAGPAVQTPGRVVRAVAQPSFVPAGHAAPASALAAPQMGEWEKMMSLIQRDEAGEFE